MFVLEYPIFKFYVFTKLLTSLRLQTQEDKKEIILHKPEGKNSLKYFKKQPRSLVKTF